MIDIDPMIDIVSNIKIFLRNINQLYHTRLGTQNEYPEGVDILSEDWDNLIILDACRYDMFEKNVDLPGNLSSRYSKGSMTFEFLKSNFSDEKLLDTVYVTASPMLYRYRSRINVEFHDVINIWRDEGWNTKYNTVLPETTAEYALEAEETYPNKRLIIHFMQPHYPYITNNTNFDKNIPDPNDGERQFWQKLFKRELSIPTEEIWKHYNQNLNEAIPSVRSLLRQLQGKTVVTSDHGNLVGERAHPIPIREWGHPDSIFVSQLLRVPWLEYVNGNRKDIVEHASKSRDDIDRETASERLRKLGYIE